MSNQETDNTQTTHRNPAQAREEAHPQDTHGEALLLMSMALDGLLDDAERNRLDLLLAHEPGLRETWRNWQKLHTTLTSVPHAQPAGDFVARFEHKLNRRERSARRRRQAIFATAAIVTWVSTAVAIVLLAWALFSNQTEWMNDFVRELVLYPSAAAITLRAVQTSLSALIGEPESLAFAAACTTALAALLYGWLLILRRTTREEIASS